MKRIVCIILTVFLLTFNVSAATFKKDGLSFKTPENYVELNLKNIKDNAELLSVLGHSEDSLKKYLSTNNIIYFSLTNDNKRQILIRSNETDFSKTLNDLNFATASELDTISQLFFDDTKNCFNVLINGNKFLQTINKDKDSGGNFVAVTYITIKNGILYTINFNYSGTEFENLNQYLDDSFNLCENLKIKANNPVHIWSANDIITFILIIVFILAILAIIIVLITSFIKDIRRKKKEDELGEIKLRRRKF